MTRDAIFKKAVRRHAGETGQHYEWGFIEPPGYYSSTAAAVRLA
jgi:hypothetical protein